MSTVDWSVGSYERTALRLHPAAEAVVEAAGPQPGERIVDVGCGTGNAALLAARRGAEVTGVDPAPRLLDVARERAEEAGLAATFVAGEGAAIPLPDGAADLVLSVFGVIFAPDAPAALAELARVTAPGGRIVLSAWIPQGTVSEGVGVARRAMLAATGAPAGPPPFAWHEPSAVAEHMAPLGFEVSSEERSISFEAASPEAYIDEEMAHHPMWIVGRGPLEARGELDRVRTDVLDVFVRGNEDPAAFRTTSRYVIVTARRR